MAGFGGRLKSGKTVFGFEAGKTGGKGGLLLLMRPAALGAGHQDDALRRRDASQALAVVQAHQELRVGIGQRGQCLRVGQQRAHFGHDAAAALLAGGHHDFLPAGNALLRPFALRPCHRTAADNGDNGRHAQLHAFLQGEIHALARRHGLHQRNRQRRLVFRRPVVQNFRHGGTLVQPRKHGGILAAVAVEQRDFFARAAAQNVQMAHHIVGQRDGCAAGERGVGEEAGHNR